MPSLTRKITIYCAICGREKTSINHWWTMEYNTALKSTYAYPLDTDEDSKFQDSRTIDVCGIEHLMLAESLVRQGEDPFKK